MSGFSSQLLLPDYSNLWSRSSPPHLIDGSRAASSSSNAHAANISTTHNQFNPASRQPHHATSQSHLAILQKNAQTRAIYHHSKGDHLPSRGGRTKWKKQLRLFEKERGYTWTGASLTEQEDRELSDEEDARSGWREHILAYGDPNIVVIGKGKTRNEEEQDMVDRMGSGPYRPPATTSSSNGQPQGQPQPQPQAHQQQQQQQRPRGQPNNAAPAASPATGAGIVTDDDVFQGEYTLDHGSSDGEEGGAIVDEHGMFLGVDDDDGDDDDGRGRGGRRGGGGGVSADDVDLDAGLQSMD